MTFSDLKGLSSLNKHNPFAFRSFCKAEFANATQNMLNIHEKLNETTNAIIKVKTKAVVMSLCYCIMLYLLFTNDV